MVTKVKGRPYFFVIITRLLKNNFQQVPGTVMNTEPKTEDKK